MPKLTPSISSILIIIALFSTLSVQAKTADKWVNLLAGDSMELWEPGPSNAKNPKGEIGDRWSLKDGVIKLDRDAEKGRGGQIWTKKSYYNFDLRFEFNIAYDGNSGIKYRTVDKDGTALGCEYQIIDDDNYRDNKNPTHRTACLYELVAVPADRKWNPAGEWNTGRIRVRDNTFEHWLNGKKVVKIKFGSDDWNARFAESKYRVHPDFAKKAGPIVLTDHQDTVSYRNITIRDLAAEQKTAKKKKEKKQAIVEPLAFSVNCKACHLLDQTLVGPSLVELAELYPRSDRDKFVQWCQEPGRKRDQMPQMPSMAHIPEPQLVEIYDYIKKITVGVTKVRRSNKDAFAKTKRPRILRTFVPESGPASVLLALPTAAKHNVVWDTEQCRLRYISVGELDNYPYLRSNGNSLAKVGDIVYREPERVFSADDVQFKGYQVSEEGYPSFLYRIGDAEVTETISAEGDAVVRSIRATPALPEYQLPDTGSEQLKAEVVSSEDSITLTYTAK